MERLELYATIKMKNTNLRRDVIFILLGFLYILYLLLFQMLRGFDDLFEILHWFEIIPRVALIIVPIYIIVLWQVRDKITSLDYHTLYIPFIFWIILTALTGAKSGANFYIIELPIVVMSLGLYLLKYPFITIFKIQNHFPVSIVLWVAICLVILTTHYFVPVLPE